MAAGNHAEKGNWALFEHAASSKNSKISLGKFSFIIRFHEQVMVVKAMDKRMKISPTRLEKIVIAPEADEEKF